MADKGSENGASDLQNLVEAVIWLILAAGAFWMTYGFDRTLPVYELGPAFWPRVLIIGIAIAALAVLLGTYMKRLRRQAEGGEPVSREKAGAEAEEEATPVTAKVVAVLCVPLLYVYLIHKGGFYLVTPFFIAGYMYLLGVRNWIKLVSITIALYGLLLLVFVKLVYTPLPQGAGYFHALNGQLIGLIQ